MNEADEETLAEWDWCQDAEYGNDMEGVIYQIQ